MEAPLEIRYAGVVIGRAQEVRSTEADADSFFLPVRDTMPVGTVLRLRSGDRETPVRVVHAVESPDAASCGMQVRMIGEAEEVAPEFIPPPAVAAEKSKPGTPTPTVEVDVKRMEEASMTAEAAAPAEAPAIIAIPAPDAVTAPAEKPVEAAPAEPGPLSSGEAAAVPEAVPETIASSMTGALVNATDSVPADEPRVSSQPDNPSAAEVTRQDTVSTAEVAPEEPASTAETGEQSKATELPPARPIAGPSGRRRTKRRR
jgi:translation initiation factor IF-2